MEVITRQQFNSTFLRAITLALIVQSCQAPPEKEELQFQYETHYTYYDSGAKRTEASVNETGELHGAFIAYHENGNKKLVSTMEHNKLSGKGKRYHPNGKLSWKGQFLNDNMIGICSKYDTSGRLYANLEYIQYEDTTIKNQQWVYTDSRELIGNQSLVYKVTLSDTVQLGDTMAVHVKLIHGAINKNARIGIGDYNEHFELRSDSIELLLAENLEATFDVLATTIGQNHIRGTIMEFGEVTDECTVSGYQLFFEKEFYVRK